METLDPGPSSRSGSSSSWSRSGSCSSNCTVVLDKPEDAESENSFSICSACERENPYPPNADFNHLKRLHWEGTHVPHPSSWDQTAIPPPTQPLAPTTMSTIVPWIPIGMNPVEPSEASRSGGCLASKGSAVTMIGILGLTIALALTISYAIIQIPTLRERLVYGSCTAKPRFRLPWLVLQVFLMIFLLIVVIIIILFVQPAHLKWFTLIPIAFILVVMGAWKLVYDGKHRNYYVDSLSPPPAYSYDPYMGHPGFTPSCSMAATLPHYGRFHRPSVQDMYPMSVEESNDIHSSMGRTSYRSFSNFDGFTL
eukprot:maker-scaffold589_size129586-snap-gene-0.50 protein:Tk07339 transcript:maker-scaffold589_size129586-snap-gene-0.50-mRNA-1 annotation:"sickle tail protein homolog"